MANDAFDNALADKAALAAHEPPCPTCGAQHSTEGTRPCAPVPVEVAKGDVVRVVKGRKYPHGLEGIVFWVGWQAPYAGRGLPEQRLGIRITKPVARCPLGPGETAWVAAKNVEVLPPDPHLQAQQALDWLKEKAAQARAEGKVERLSGAWGWFERRITDLQKTGRGDPAILAQVLEEGHHAVSL